MNSFLTQKSKVKMLDFMPHEGPDSLMMTSESIIMGRESLTHSEDSAPPDTVISHACLLMLSHGS